MYFSFISIIGSLLISSCALKDVNYGKVTLHSTGERNSFIFTVSEEFLEKNFKDLGKEVKNQSVKISKAEYKLLRKLLNEKKLYTSK
jgi:hypothetical protein